MKTLFKTPLFYTNVLLLVLVVMLAANANIGYAKFFGFVSRALAAVGAISGEGTVNFLASFAGATPSNQIGNSIIYDSGTNIGISTETPGAKLDINAGADNLLRLRQGANPATTFRVGTDGAMIIDNDGVSNAVTLNAGNVGIGTAVPGAKLEVKASNNDWGAGIWIRDYETSNYYNFTYDDRLRIGYNSTGMLVIDTAGNVGIGTTAPGGKLDIYSATAGTGVTAQIRHADNTNAASHAVLRINTGGASGGDAKFLLDTGAATVWNFGVDNSDSDKLKFSNGATGALETGTLLTIQTNGNVGVGATSPGAKLEVAGQIKITGGTPGAGKVLTSDAAGLATWGTAGGGLGGGGTVNYVSKFTGASTLGNSQIFDNGTNVGIGTAAPATKLEISSGDLRLSNGYTLQWGSASNRIYNASNVFYLDTNGTNRITVDANGNVGIGTTAPGTKIDTTGTIRSTGLGSAPSGVGAEMGYSSNVGYFITYDRSLSQVKATHLGGDGGTGLRVDTAGNVGIGATAPSAKLEVADGTYNINTIKTTAAGHSSGMGVEGYSTYWGTAIFQDGTPRLVIDSNGAVLVGTNYVQGTGPANGMAIEGSVGIGVANPQASLHVNGAMMLTPLASDPPSPQAGMIWLRN